MISHITGTVENGVQTTLLEKDGRWFTTCPACGKAHDVSADIIDSGDYPVCCTWAFRIFDRSYTPPRYEPRWEFMGEILKAFV